MLLKHFTVTVLAGLLRIKVRVTLLLTTVALRVDLKYPMTKI